MRRWTLILGLVGVVAVGGLAIWHQTNRVHFVQTLCEAGLPNLSRPAGVNADDLDCVVLGPSRRVSGFLVGQYHGRTLIVGDALRFDDHGAFANEVLDMAGGTGRSSRGWDSLRDMGINAPEACFVMIWRVTMDGWSTETDGPFGHGGLPSRGFFADQIFSIEPVTLVQVARVGPRMREHACVWTGEGGWLHLGADSPAPPVLP
jgi:hypothetical protein